MCPHFQANPRSAVLRGPHNMDVNVNNCDKSLDSIYTEKLVALGESMGLDEPRDVLKQLISIGEIIYKNGCEKPETPHAIVRSLGEIVKTLSLIYNEDGDIGRQLSNLTSLNSEIAYAFDGEFDSIKTYLRDICLANSNLPQPHTTEYQYLEYKLMGKFREDTLGLIDRIVCNICR